MNAEFYGFNLKQLKQNTIMKTILITLITAAGLVMGNSLPPCPENSLPPCPETIIIHANL